MEYVLGIDLGTSNTCVALMLNETPKVVADGRGRSTTPSVLAVNRNGKFLVGHRARSQLVSNPYGTVHSAKRLIGQRFSASNVQRALQYLPFEVIEGEDGMSLCVVGSKRLSPTEVSATVLKTVKRLAEEALGVEVKRAVITVPAHFDNAQRKATKDAAERAGLEVMRLINEPTAAALAYGFEEKKEGCIAVFDFGGGTFDISILEICDGVYEVISTGGDSYLGGDDFNQKVADCIIERFRKKTGINLALDRMAAQRVLDAAEHAKIRLSAQPKARVQLPRIAPNVDIDMVLDDVLTREEVDEMCVGFVEHALRICEETFEAARISLEDLDEVVLVGGMSKMPMVRRMATEFFGREPVAGINPDEVVAIGASIQADALLNYREDVLLLDVVPMTLGIRVKGDLFSPLIPRNTKVPFRYSHIFTTSRDNQERVRVAVFQGEESRCESNILLGEFDLEGIPLGPRMSPKIQVTFRIDPNGILEVTAEDLATQQSNSIKIVDIAERVQEQGSFAGPAAEELKDDDFLDLA